MNRQEILEFINKIIEEEHGKTVTEDNLLTDSEIDSFGYAVFWLEINSNYQLEEIKGLDFGIDYETLTVKNIIDYIISKDSKNIIRIKDENK